MFKPQRLVEVVRRHEEISHSIKMGIHGTRKGVALGLRDNYPIGGWLSRVQYWIITLIDTTRTLFSEIPMIKCVTLTKTKRKYGLDVNLVFDGVGYEKHAASIVLMPHVLRSVERPKITGAGMLMCVLWGRVLAPLQNQPKPSFQGDTE